MPTPSQPHRSPIETPSVARVLQDIFSGERDNKNMPDISHLKDAKGNPLKHNRSCHVCTQGNASWRGGFFQPIGCSYCCLIFCFVLSQREEGELCARVSRRTSFRHMTSQKVCLVSSISSLFDICLTRERPPS